MNKLTKQSTHQALPQNSPTHTDQGQCVTGPPVCPYLSRDWPPCSKTPVDGQSLCVNSRHNEGWSNPALNREGHIQGLLRPTLADGYSFPRPLNASVLAGQKYCFAEANKEKHITHNDKICLVIILDLYFTQYKLAFHDQEQFNYNIKSVMSDVIINCLDLGTTWYLEFI